MAKHRKGIFIVHIPAKGLSTENKKKIDTYFHQHQARQDYHLFVIFNMKSPEEEEIRFECFHPESIPRSTLNKLSYDVRKWMLSAGATEEKNLEKIQIEAQKDELPF